MVVDLNVAFKKAIKEALKVTDTKDRARARRAQVWVRAQSVPPVAVLDLTKRDLAG